MQPGMRSSLRIDWATPSNLFHFLEKEFCFDLDACAEPDTAKAARFFTKEQDGLAQEWSGTVWMNPPYGRTIGAWIRKAHSEALRGATVVCLLPARTDTSWWHDYCMKAAEVRFLRGRLSFDNQRRGRAPFPSAIVVFRSAD